MESAAAWAPLALGLVGAGAFAGLLAGLLGVGGGIVVVPALYNLFLLLEVPPGPAMQVAVGTSLATILPTGARSALAHHGRGAVDWQVVRLWGPAIALGVLLGAGLARIVDGRVLTGLFAMLALAVAAPLTFVKAERTLRRGLPPSPVRESLGGAIGLISALVGIGGGSLSVPTLTLCGFEIRRAVGTGAALGVVIAAFGAAGFALAGLGQPGRPAASLGFVNLIGFLAVVPTMVLMAPLGARLAHALPGALMRRLFALFLVIMAARMIATLL